MLYYASYIIKIEFLKRKKNVASSFNTVVMFNQVSPNLYVLLLKNRSNKYSYN